jgi:hypothetical protein
MRNAPEKVRFAFGEPTLENGCNSSEHALSRNYFLRRRQNKIHKLQDLVVQSVDIIALASEHDYSGQQSQHALAHLRSTLQSVANASLGTQAIREGPPFALPLIRFLVRLVVAV